MNSSKKTIWAFFISKHRFTNLIILLALFLGIFSIIQIPKESNPEIDIPFVIVSTPFPGASAEEVEELVTDIIEDRLLGLNGVKRVNSTSNEGFSNIIVEFNPETKTEDQENSVQDKVNEAKIDLPDKAEDPIVRKIEASDDPILMFSLSGPYNTIQLKKFAEDLKNEIEKIPDISEVNVIGGQEREIRIIVNKSSLNRYGLSISQVTNAIRQANADIPTGTIKTAGTEYVVRLAGRLNDIEDIKSIPIASINNTSILVKDVAEIIDDYEEITSISRLSINGDNLLPSITITIKKSKGGNIIRLVDSVREIIDNAEKDFLPENINVEILLDLGEFIKRDLNKLTSSGIQTIFIIFILLYLFIGAREAFIASLAVPFSFFITFIFLSFFGYTLNFLSLFSLILALGILIDTAVVIIERMNVYINQYNKDPKEAAILTVHEFQLPLIVGTLTTVFAFVPMLLMSGIMGEYMKFIPITVTIVLLSSLFVGLAIIPALSAKRLKLKTDFVKSLIVKNGIFKFFNSIRNRIFNLFIYLTGRYKRALIGLIENKKRQRVFFITVIILFFFSLSLPVTGVLKMNMFPPEDSDLFFISIKKPIGTLLEDTSKTIKDIENILLNDSNIKSFAVSIGRPLFFGGTGENFAEITINLKKDRTERSPDMVEKYQDLFDELIDAEVSLIQLSSGPPSASPVDIGIRGDSLEELEILILELKEVLEDVPGTRNIKTSVEESKGEFVINIDRAKAQLFGVSTIQLAQVLSNAVQGTEATVLRNQGEEISVIVKYNLDPININQGDTDTVDISALESLTIATIKGDIPLSAFTSTELNAGRIGIKHEDGKRTLRLTSFNEADVAPVEIIQGFQNKISDLNIPAGIEVIYGGEQEDLEQSYNDMFKAMILAIFLIAGILVLQFSSYRQPLFVLISIPLSFIGVFPGLVLIDKFLTLPAIIGIVALAGIVVNNGIILVDMINKNRRKNMDKKEAIFNACTVRFRPIILTTITTIIGILPITFSSELWGGLGFTIIFGLTVSAALTLFMVPLLYFKFAEKEL